LHTAIVAPDVVGACAEVTALRIAALAFVNVNARPLCSLRKAAATLARETSDGVHAVVAFWTGGLPWMANVRKVFVKLDMPINHRTSRQLCQHPVKLNIRVNCRPRTQLNCSSTCVLALVNISAGAVHAVAGVARLAEAAVRPGGVLANGVAPARHLAALVNI
jgi:hypothetical protein